MPYWPRSSNGSTPGACHGDRDGRRRARLPLSVEREFCRVAKEAVANAERHGRASKISVLWRCREDGALLEVSDDGIGMSGPVPVRASGYGLIGMRERADSVQAKLEVHSQVGAGTVVRMQEGGFVTLRIVIADDHTMVREALRLAFERAGFAVVGEASDGQEAVEQAEAHRPDVVLVDMSLPVLSGVAAAKQIANIVPRPAVVVLSMLSDEMAVSSALAAGATGYLVKDCTTAEIVEGVLRAVQGEQVLSASASVPTSMTDGAVRQVGYGPLSSNRLISKREEEVLRLMATGVSISRRPVSSTSV